MNSLPMSSRRVESEAGRRGWWRSFVALALFAAAPKCLLCLAVWLGLGTLLGVGGPELCGAVPGTVDAETVALYVGAGLALGALGYKALRARGRNRPAAG